MRRIPVYKVVDGRLVLVGHETSRGDELAIYVFDDEEYVIAENEEKRVHDGGSFEESL